MGKVFFKSENNFDLDEESAKFGTVNVEPSLTLQDEAGEADINQIMQRFGVTGTVTLTKRSPLPDDYLRVSSFHEAANIVREAQESFNELPADVRSKFDNDPGKFEAYLQDPDNANVLLKSNLVNKIIVPVPPAPMKVEVVNPVPAPV